MKKLLLLLIVLTTLANVSSASFPVKGTTHSIEVEESINLNESPRRDITWIYSFASFLLGILGWLFVFMLIGGAMGGSPDSVLDRFFIFYIISSVGAVLLGGMAVIKKSKGYILGILGAVLGVLALSLMIFSR
jgi:hypothetical protein